MNTYNPTYANSYALIVGIDLYADPRFMPLGNAEADALEVARVLSASPYDFRSSTILGSEATRQAILEALFQLREAGPDDRILVYFAGHGYTLTNKRGYDTGYLACADTLPEQDFTALELAEVTRLRDHTDAKHIAFIFDACFSGQALGMTRAISEGYLERRAYQVLSAGAGDQTVSDYRSMTRLLIDSLQAPPREVLSLNALGLHIQSVMRAESRGRQVPQIGHLTGSQGGDFVFRWPETGQYPAAAAPMREPTPSPRPDTVESVQIARPEPRPRRNAPRANTLWIGAGILGAILVLGIIGVVVVSGWIRERPGAQSAQGAETPSVEPTDSPAQTPAPTEVTTTQEPSAEITTAPTAGPTAIPVGLASITRNDDWTPMTQDVDGVAMALVPVGCFQMGSSGGDSDEQPIHEQCFTAPFWIDVYEVTNSQYGSSAQSGGSDYPYDSADWRAATNHCASREARLPTEAEWEYAARGPGGLLFPWGNQFDDSMAKLTGGFGDKTRAVGSYPLAASWVGALDMNGNVWEWVSSVYRSYPFNAADGREDTRSLVEGTEQGIIRGGSWDSFDSPGDASDHNSAYRYERWPNSVSTNGSFGFRCARDY